LLFYLTTTLGGNETHVHFTGLIGSSPCLLSWDRSRFCVSTTWDLCCSACPLYRVHFSLETPAQINIDQRITDESNTDLSNTHSILSDEARPSVLAALEAKRKEAEYRDMDMYREIIKENIGYDYLLSDLPYDHDRLEEILELLVETVCSTKKYIRVAGADYPAEVVRSRLLKLDMEHIRFVFDCLNENTTKIRNIKQYLLTTLYNAPATIGNYYSALVQHDLYGSSRD